MRQLNVRQALGGRSAASARSWLILAVPSTLLVVVQESNSNFDAWWITLVSAFAQHAAVGLLLLAVPLLRRRWPVLPLDLLIPLWVAVGVVRGLVSGLFAENFATIDPQYGYRMLSWIGVSLVWTPLFTYALAQYEHRRDLLDEFTLVAASLEDARVRAAETSGELHSRLVKAIRRSVAPVIDEIQASLARVAQGIGTDSFATIGSTSILDSGGAATAQRCGIPDIRATSLSNERANCTVCYPTQASRTGDLSEGPYKQLRRENKAATDNAAYMYLNTGGSPILAQAHSEVAKSAGFNVKFIQSVETTDFNYGPYVQRLKNEKIRYVYFFGADPQAVRLVKAMESAGYKPDILQLAQTNFSAAYVKNGGKAADRSLIWVPHSLFTQPNAEMSLYLRWLQQAVPGADPSSFGVFAWSASRLFVEKSIALGGKLTRASLVQAVKKETSWTANGIHTKMDVGGKSTFQCAYLTRLNGGVWTQSPKTPICGKIIRTKFHE